VSARVAGMPVPVLALRALVAVSGATALLPGWEAGLPSVAVLAGGVALVLATLRPGSHASTAVLAAAVLAWTVRYGRDAPPPAGTVLVALAVAAHHQAAALAAALPPATVVDRAVLTRAGRHAALVLGLSAAVAALALGPGDLAASVPLELLGLAAAVLAVAVPVLLGRRTDPPG
jgi:hypothetical protein